MHELEIKFATDLTERSAHFAREATQAKEKLEAEALELSLAYDQKSVRDREEAEKQKGLETTKMEEQRAMQVGELRKLHEKQIAVLKKWFRDVTTSNSSTIETLKVSMRTYLHFHVKRFNEC